MGSAYLANEYIPIYYFYCCSLGDGCRPIGAHLSIG